MARAAEERSDVALRLTGVSFAYQRDLVLEDVSFSVAAGEFVALVGPNGSGKSTLLRVLLGLLAPLRGSVELLGAPPGRLRDPGRLGYVPQRPGLVDHLPATVSEVVAAGRLSGRRWARRLGRADWVEVDHAIESVELTELRHRRLSELSGGQQQRAFIAKALVTGPDLLVLDEPVAGVDAESQLRFRRSVVHLVREHGGSVLLVSHELGAVADELDRLIVLRRGRIAFDGTPDELVARGVSLGIHSEDLPLWLEGLDPA